MAGIDLNDIPPPRPALDLDLDLPTTQVIPKATLPAELVDDIISELCRTAASSSSSSSSTTSKSNIDADTNMRTLSSIALTSHICRVHANKARFSALTLFRTGCEGDGRYTTRRIKALAGIVRSGRVMATMPGVCTFAMSFSLHMEGFYDEVMPTIEGGDLAYIFDNLFRPASSSASRTPHNSKSVDRSLELYIWPYSRPIPSQGQRRAISDSSDICINDHPRYGALSWSALRASSPGLVRALEDLLRNSQLNRLSLHSVRNLPRDLLLGSSITHLYLRNISDSGSGNGACGLCDRDYSCICSLECQEDGDGDGNTGTARKQTHLASLDIDGTSVLSSILGSLQAHRGSGGRGAPGDMFPYLTALSMKITSSFDMMIFDDVLANIPSLESLSIMMWVHKVDFAKHQSDFVLHVDHLTHLQSISFTYDSRGPMSALLQLLQHTPPMLAELDVTILLETNRPQAEAVRRYLDKINVDLLDKCLAFGDFEEIERIVVTLEIELSRSLREIGHKVTAGNLGRWEFLAGKLPLLCGQRRAGGLEVVVTLKD